MAKNPFPGMNPYLERHWGDVHARLILYSSDQLNRRLLGPLRARVEERLVVENLETEKSRPVRPDVSVYDSRKSPAPDFGGGGIAVLDEIDLKLEPDVVQMVGSEPETTTFLRIIDASTGGTLVTVIEFLSPANKEHEETAASKLYQAKRAELEAGGVSLVEIDLLRAGERFFPTYDNRYGKCLSATYAACVNRSWRPGKYEIYSFDLRSPLPSIRIPLRKQDEDVWLSLQPLVQAVYENGRYDDIDYARPLYPPLNDEDTKWAAGLLAKS